MDAERRRVVTALLRRRGQVLLLRRSPAVSAYRGRWAGVSGRVEPGEWPDDAVWRELLEETSLPRESVARVRAGLAQDIDDGPRSFRVHPYLFDLAEGAEPELDWEHTDTEWVDPDEVEARAAAGRTVPALDETLRRVWDPVAALEPQFREEAREIFEDRRRGASELAPLAVALVRRGAPAERVAALRPTMVPLVNAARGAADPSRDVGAELSRASDHARNAARRELVKARRVATFSRSSTVIGALEGTPPLCLLVGRSVPGAEGESTAEAASAAGHDVTLLEDDELTRRVRRGDVDLVLVGADAVTNQGDVVNKVGTRPLAEAARAAGVPFVVAADTFKRWPDDVPPPLEPIFDVTRAALVTKLLG